MLEITIPGGEIYNSKTNRFIEISPCIITLEHSLISLAKWESKWHIPYLSDKERTSTQEMDYIKCMIIGTLKDKNILEMLTPDNVSEIKKYIDNPMTAATFSKHGASKLKKEIITAETLYCRMFANDIPIECQKWHLNRLIALIRACDIYNGPRKKMSKQQTAKWNAEQNAARRAKFNSRG